MKNPLLKKILPHLIAVVIFLAVSMLFCKPALEGNKLNQSDINGWKGMAQNAFEYKEKNGHFPLWNPNLFSGMPNYQVAMDGKSVLTGFTDLLLHTLPVPIGFFFLAAVCFYILCMALSIKPVIAIFGGLAYAFATYNPVIISVGHESKMWAIVFMPLLLAGLLCTFEKKYWLGLGLTSFATYIEIGVNHPQISFYFFLVAVAVTISYLVIWIKQKEWKHIALAAGITAIAAIAGLAGNALALMTTSEYTEFTMRGGKDVSIEGDKVEAAKTSGLDTSYAFQYSAGKGEAAVLLMPNAFGGSSNKTLDENSKVVDKLVARGAPESTATQIAASLPKYWGGLPQTSGPPYVGAVICLLALIGFVLYKSPLRWGLLAVTVLAIMMSWGKYLPGFNTFLFNHLPLYNKFRAPSMSLVITQLTLTVMAVLILQQLLYRDNARELLKTNFKKILYATGGLFALLAIMYLTMDYSAPEDGYILANKWDNSGTDEIGRLIISGMKADRRAMFGGQLMRTLGFTIALLALLYMFIKNVIKPLAVSIVLLIISTADLLIVDKDYLNDDNYRSPEELVSEHFTPTEIDKQILQDKDPDFRVFTANTNLVYDSRPSYFYKSVSGYHPARLRTYQDIIDKYLTQYQNLIQQFGPAVLNQDVLGILNMLNTKYVVYSDQQTNQQHLASNPNAYGSCWLVKNVKIVDNRVAAIQLLGTTQLKDTAIVEKSFSNLVIQPHWDSTSSIQLTKFDNDAMEYKANCNGPQFAVFSEIYYPKGWNAYVDGKKTDYCNVNYILRGLSLPAGTHTVKFVFEPASYKKGIKISYAASFLVLLFFAGGLFMQWRQDKKRNATVA